MPSVAINGEGNTAYVIRYQSKAEGTELPSPLPATATGRAERGEPPTIATVVRHRRQLLLRRRGRRSEKGPSCATAIFAVVFCLTREETREGRGKVAAHLHGTFTTAACFRQVKGREGSTLAVVACLPETEVEGPVALFIRNDGDSRDVAAAVDHHNPCTAARSREGKRSHSAHIYCYAILAGGTSRSRVARRCCPYCKLASLSVFVFLNLFLSSCTVALKVTNWRRYRFPNVSFPQKRINNWRLICAIATEPLQKQAEESKMEAPKEIFLKNLKEKNLCIVIQLVTFVNRAGAIGSEDDGMGVGLFEDRAIDSLKIELLGDKTGGEGVWITSSIPRLLIDGNTGETERRQLGSPASSSSLDGLQRSGPGSHVRPGDSLASSVSGSSFDVGGSSGQSSILLSLVGNGNRAGPQQVSAMTTEQRLHGGGCGVGG
nr:puromycin-sensitive aminopeptidase isoform X3 [Ipomoea trifida]